MAMSDEMFLECCDQAHLQPLALRFDVPKVTRYAFYRDCLCVYVAKDRREAEAFVAGALNALKHREQSVA